MSRGGPSNLVNQVFGKGDKRKRGRNARNLPALVNDARGYGDRRRCAEAPTVVKTSLI